jgi:hypothetical protein
LSDAQTISFKAQFDVRGVDQSIRDTQRLLYFVNAVRLSVVDIQQVISGPTLSNILWTTIQLTRAWTHLHRIITAANKAQRVGVAQGILGGAMRGGMGAVASRGFTAGQQVLSFGAGGMLGISAPSAGMFATLSAFALANPILAGLAVLAVTTSALGYREYFMDRKRRNDRREFIRRQREIAKTQGYEY